MIDGGVDPGANARNLFFEDGDAGAELVDRKRIEILADEQGQRILGLVREELVEIHRRRFCPLRRPVNRGTLRSRAFPASVAR